MSIVFKLPIDIVKEILCRWVDLIAISKLDRCISGLYTRRSFLDLISSPKFIFSGREVGGKVDGDYYRWLFNRNLSVEVITVGNRNHTIGCYLKTKVCAHLKRLDFSAGQDVSGLILANVFPLCPNLEEFLFAERNLDNVMNQDAFYAISQHCKKLRLFELSNNRVVNGDMVKLLVTHCGDLREISFLFCYGVDDEAMEAISSHCPHLVHLSIQASESVSDVGMSAIAMHCWELSSLYIVACSRITGTSISLVCKNCPLLEELTLSTLLITNATLAEIAQHCAILRRLVLTRCSLITDSAVLDLVVKCRLLVYLDVRYCYHLSKEQLCEQIRNVVKRADPILCITMDCNVADLRDDLWSI